MSKQITINGGIGKDNMMDRLGDFMDTVLRMYREMIFHEQEPPFVLSSNLPIKTEAQMYNHFYIYMNKSEHDFILEQPFISNWVVNNEQKYLSMNSEDLQIIINTDCLELGW